MEEKIRVLIVDDEEHFVEALRRRLELRGFAVAAALSGEEALRVARNNFFHAALVDLKMPGMNGCDTMIELKKLIKGIDIIIVTGHGSESASEMCMKSGAFAFLHKPCDLEEMIDVLLKAAGT